MPHRVTQSANMVGVYPKDKPLRIVIGLYSKSEILSTQKNVVQFYTRHSLLTDKQRTYKLASGHTNSPDLIISLSHWDIPRFQSHRSTMIIWLLLLWRLHGRLLRPCCTSSWRWRLGYTANSTNINEKALGETQTLRTGCSKASLKFSPRCRPRSRGAGRQNLISWRRSLPSPTDPVWWRSINAISSYRGNRRINNARPSQTGPITIHCAAKLSAQCNYSSYWKISEDLRKHSAGTSHSCCDANSSSSSSSSSLMHKSSSEHSPMNHSTSGGRLTSICWFSSFVRYC